MAIIQHEINTYMLYHMTNDYAGKFGQGTIINCYDSSASCKGLLYFYKEGATIPSNSKSSSSEILYLRFRESQLADIINTLRYEKHLYIWFNDIILCAGLKTSKESIGEEES